MNVRGRLPAQHKLRHDDARARAHREAVPAEACSDNEPLYPGGLSDDRHAIWSAVDVSGPRLLESHQTIKVWKEAK